MNLRPSRRGLRRGAVLTVAGTLLIPVAAAAQAATPDTASTPSVGADDRPTLLQASLPDGAAAASLQAFAVPAPTGTEEVGDTRALLPVPAELTGELPFSVVLDPTRVPDSVRSDTGVVDFTLFIRDRSGTSWTTSLSARGGAVPSTDPTAGVGGFEHRWVQAHLTDHDVTAVTAPSGYPVLAPDAEPGTDPGTARVAASSSADTYDYDDEVVDVNPHEFVRAEVPSVKAPAAGPGADCLHETYTGDVNVSTTIGTSYPIGTTTSKMVHTNSSTNSSYLGVAVGHESDSGSGFTYKQSGSRYTEGSWEGNWNASDAKRSYRILTNYHKWVLGKGCNGEARYRKPHIEIGGGSSNTTGLTRPGWDQFCAAQPRNFTFTRTDTDGKAYSYGAAVKFMAAIGVDLSISKQYSSRNALHYTFSGDVRHKLCGKDDYPSMASKMIDRYL